MLNLQRRSTCNHPALFVDGGADEAAIDMDIAVGMSDESGIASLESTSPSIGTRSTTNKSADYALWKNTKCRTIMHVFFRRLEEPFYSCAIHILSFIVWSERDIT